MKAEIDLRFDPEPEVVSTARHALDRLENLLPSGKLENVRLVVSFQDIYSGCYDCCTQSLLGGTRTYDLLIRSTFPSGTRGDTGG